MAEIVLDHLYQAFKEYIELSMTKHLEAALYSEYCKRKRGKAVRKYTARRQILFRYLDRAGIRLPDEAKGHLLLRDWKIYAQAWDTFTTWTKRSYDYTVIISCLRRLERPMPGRGGRAATSLGVFLENNPDGFSGFGSFDDEYFCRVCGSDNDRYHDHVEIYLNNLLYHQKVLMI